MSNMRVVLRDVPKMLRDILERAISDELDMEIVSEPISKLMESPRTDDRRLSPDVVISTSDSQPAEGARSLLAQWPRSHVLIITERGGKVLWYELSPRGVDLGEMSPDQLVQTIRSLVRPERKLYEH